MDSAPIEHYCDGPIKMMKNIANFGNSCLGTLVDWEEKDIQMSLSHRALPPPPLSSSSAPSQADYQLFTSFEVLCQGHQQHLILGMSWRQLGPSCRWSRWQSGDVVGAQVGGAQVGGAQVGGAQVVGAQAGGAQGLTGGEEIWPWLADFLFWGVA